MPSYLSLFNTVTSDVSEAFDISPDTHALTLGSDGNVIDVELNNNTRGVQPHMLPNLSDDQVEAYAKKLFLAAAEDSRKKYAHYDTEPRIVDLEGNRYSVGLPEYLGIVVDGRSSGKGCGMFIQTHAVTKIP